MSRMLTSLGLNCGYGWVKQQLYSSNPSNFETRFLRKDRYLRYCKKCEVSAGVLRNEHLDYILELAEDATAILDGPVELPQELDPYAFPEASPLRIAASVVLLGLIAFLLNRSLRRRFKQAKEKRFRSSSVLSVKAEAAIENLKTIPQIEKIQKKSPTPNPPDAWQTLLGAVIAGVISIGLFNFTQAVESSFASKPVSADYSIRNLTITVRTIINGICYLATFVFAANSLGLTLYGFSLLFNLAPKPEVEMKTDSDENTTEVDNSN